MTWGRLKQRRLKIGETSQPERPLSVPQAESCHISNRQRTSLSCWGMKHAHRSLHKLRDQAMALGLVQIQSAIN